MPKFDRAKLLSNMGTHSAPVSDLGSGLLNAESRALLNGDLNITYIPVNLLHVAACNTYSVDPDAIADLADSINDVGLLENLTVIREGEGYAILSGQRRFYAINKLIEEGRLPANYSVPCDVKDLAKISLADAELDDDTKALYIAATSNEVREMTPADRLLRTRQLTTVYDAIKAQGGRDRVGNRKDFVADSLGVSPRTAQSLINIEERGSDTLKEAVASGTVSVKVADALSSLDAAQQDELMDAAGVDELEEGEEANITVKDVQDFKDAAQKRTKERVKNNVRGKTVVFSMQKFSTLELDSDCKTLAEMLSTHTVNQQIVDDMLNIDKQIEKLYARLRKLLEKEVQPLALEMATDPIENIPDGLFDEDTDSDSDFSDDLTF